MTKAALFFFFVPQLTGTESVNFSLLQMKFSV